LIELALVSKTSFDIHWILFNVNEKFVSFWRRKLLPLFTVKKQALCSLLLVFKAHLFLRLWAFRCSWLPLDGEDLEQFKPWRGLFKTQGLKPFPIIIIIRQQKYFCSSMRHY
jgi:hypothetical protein